MAREPHPVITNVIPVNGNVVWFDMTGTPYRVLGFALSVATHGNGESFPIIDVPYGMPEIDWNTGLVTEHYYQGIFYGRVPMDEVLDNLQLYRNMVNSLEREESYLRMITDLGITIINDNILSNHEL